MLSAAVCLQVTALSTSGFTSPWAGGRTGATATTDTNTGRGPRRGTRLMMERNPPRTVCLPNALRQTPSSVHPEPVWPAHIIKYLLSRRALSFSLPSISCPSVCSGHTSSEGAVSAGDGGRRRGAHPPRPVHRAGRNLPQGGRGRRMERDSQVHYISWVCFLRLNASFYRAFMAPRTV